MQSWEPGVRGLRSGQSPGVCHGRGPQGSLRSLLRPVGVSPDRRVVTGDVHIVGQAGNKDSPAAKRSQDDGP